jgi:prohibitin 1
MDWNEDPRIKKSQDEDGNIVRNLILAGVALVLIVVTGCSSCTTMPAGYVGVVTVFGGVTGQRVYQGLHFINPVAWVTKMSTQTTELKESASVPSKEGLILNLDASLLYHLDAEQAPHVYETVGDKYASTIVEPIFRASLREATASHDANALYSSERDEVAHEITASVTAQLAVRGVVVENVLLRDIALPDTLKNAIEQKQQAEQESLAMSFRLQKETQEAQRKRIEAQGIKDFQTIVSQGISEPLLQWKGIEATEKLASSQNTKIVVIGGKNGLPLIMNDK